MSPNRIEPNEYRVKPGAKVSLRKWSTSATDGFDGDKEQGAALLPALNERLAELTARGVVLKPKRPDSSSYPIGPRKAGALQRFLGERE